MIRVLASLLLAAAATKPAPPPPPPDLAAPPVDAIRSATGLVSRVLAPATGTARAADDNIVKLRYTVWTSAGKLIDHVPPPQSRTAPVATLLPGLREAVLEMKEGEARRVWIRESLGAAGKVPAGGMLVVDLQLLGVIVPPSVPPSVNTVPADATKTKSGLAYRVLRPGAGRRHPRSSDTVVVDYSGWSSNGRLIDSSVLRGEPAEFPLSGVIAGWREGLALMTEGEKARLWIPAKLAYDGEAGKPQGMLVFDVELVKIK